MAQDYYKTLGVGRSASDDEIQKAYRKLARKYHPDIAEDKEVAKHKFQEVQQAYDILSDPKKRKLYDQFGPDFEKYAGAAPFQSGNGGRQMDIDLNDLFGGRGPFAGGGGGGFEDILRQFGGGFPQGDFPQGGFDQGGFQAGFDPSGFHSRTAGETPARAGKDIQQEATVPFHTAVLGGQHQITLQRQNGKIEEFKFKVPAGIEDGKKIRLRGQGQPDPRTGESGDLLIRIRVAPHPWFRRRGNHLAVQLPISYREAALGGKVDLQTPHGTISVTVPPGSSSHKSLRLKGMGIKPDKGNAGDLFVELKIVVPDVIDEPQKQWIEKLDDSAFVEKQREQICW